MASALFDRAEYPTLREVVYLNQASLGLIGRPAVAAMQQFLEDVARHGNTRLTDEEEVRLLDGLRSRAASLYGADKEHVAVTSGASELLGQIPLILDRGGKKGVLAVSTDFPAVTRPWLRLEGQGDYRVTFVHDQPDVDLTDALIDRIDSDTAVVAVGSVQYATGTVVDIPRLRSATTEAGAYLVVDATQEVGAMDRAIGSWEADAVVSSGYKWLGGHGGVAVGVIGRRLLDELPALPGWMSASDPFDFDATRLPFWPDARRYTLSTISYVSAVGLTASIDRLLAVGSSEVERHATTLSRILTDQVEPLGWHAWRQTDDPSASPHIVSLAGDGIDMGRALRRIRDAGIVVSGRGGRIRVSLAPYNDEGDVAALARVLEHASQ